MACSLFLFLEFVPRRDGEQRSGTSPHYRTSSLFTDGTVFPGYKKIYPRFFPLKHSLTCYIGLYIIIISASLLLVCGHFEASVQLCTGPLLHGWGRTLWSPPRRNKHRLMTTLIHYLILAKKMILTYYTTIFSEYMMSSVVTNSMDSMPTNFSIQWRRTTLLILHFFFKDATTRH